MLSSFNLIFAQECQLAIPRYGVVECYDMGDLESHQIVFKSVNDESHGSFTCISDCELTYVPEVDCGGWGTHWKIQVNGDTKYEESSVGEGKNYVNIKFDRGDTLTVVAYCREWLGGKHPLPINSIEVWQELIMLKEGWAGTLPTTTISNTEGCTLNKVVDRYKGDTDVTSFLNPVTGSQETKPSSTYSSVHDMPTNWKVGDNYIFVKDWETGIADISLTYDKDNNPYWCGGVSGSRKIYRVEEITSVSGKCYAIPKSIYLSNVECCFPADCSWKGTTYTCNPETWKCEETKPCNTQLDCDQVFGEGICQNKQVIKWTCDFSEKWGNYAGTCTKQTKSVSQCPSDCTSDEYYNEDEGKCKPRVVLLDCPAGKCCKSGGNYKPKDCPSGLNCCLTAGSIIGNCKAKCGEEETTENGGESLFPPGMFTSAGSIIAGIVIVAIVIGVVAWKKGYLHFERGAKTITPVKEVKPTPKKTVKTNVVFCTQCGSKQSKGTKFCTNCGHKLK